MKKITTVFGIIFVLLLLFAAILIHWQLPGRFIVSLLAGIMGAPFALTYFIMHYRSKRNLPYMLTGIITANLLFPALLFRLNHYPGAGLLMNLSLICGLTGLLIVWLTSSAYKDTTRRMPHHRLLSAASVLLMIYLAAMTTL